MIANGKHEKNSTFGRMLNAVLSVDNTMKDLIRSQSTQRKRNMSTAIANGGNNSYDFDHEHHDEGCSNIQKHAVTLLISIVRGLKFGPFLNC